MGSPAVSFAQRPETSASISLEDDSDVAKKGKLRQGKPKGVAGLSLVGSSHSMQIRECASRTQAGVSSITSHAAQERSGYEKGLIVEERSFAQAQREIEASGLNFDRFEIAAMGSGAVAGAVLGGMAGESFAIRMAQNEAIRAHQYRDAIQAAQSDIVRQNEAKYSHYKNLTPHERETARGELKKGEQNARNLRHSGEKATKDATKSALKATTTTGTGGKWFGRAAGVALGAAAAKTVVVVAGKVLSPIGDLLLGSSEAH
jgi:hypothetical protein